MPSVETPQDQIAPKTSVAAIWSLVFGLSSFCLWILGSIPAIILGIIALVKINGSQGRLQGRALAITGIITGGSGFFVAAILAAMMIPAFVAVQEKAKIVTQENDVRVLVTACRYYAEKNGGKFPDALQDLYPDYIDDKSALKTMNGENQELEPYMYFSGKTVESEPRSLLIASPVIQKRHFRVVGFCDSSVENIEDVEFYRLAELEYDKP